MAGARTSATRKSDAMPAGDLTSRLRMSITSGNLVPNQRLVESDLVTEYGASRGNVRIALSALASEGLVERVQNRGAKVRSVSLQEAVEITEVRAAVESLCARRAAARVQPAEAENLQEIGRRMTRAVTEGDLRTYSENNRALHELIVQISEQRTAAATIARLRSQAVRYQYRIAQRPGRAEKSLSQHLAIIDAICAHETDRAAEAMQVHIDDVAHEIQSTSTERP